MKKLLLVVLSLNFLSGLTFAQKDKNPPQITFAPSNDHSTASEKKVAPSITERLEKLDGTYQFQLTKTGYNILFTEELLNTLETSRKANEDVFLVWDEFTTIYLPSSEKLHLQDFKPIPQFIYNNQ